MGSCKLYTYIKRERGSVHIYTINHLVIQCVLFEYWHRETQQGCIRPQYDTRTKMLLSKQKSLQHVVHFTESYLRAERSCGCPPLYFSHRITLRDNSNVFHKSTGWMLMIGKTKIFSLVFLVSFFSKSFFYWKKLTLFLKTILTVLIENALASRCWFQLWIWSWQGRNCTWHFFLHESTSKLSHFQFLKLNKLSSVCSFQVIFVRLPFLYY